MFALEWCEFCWSIRKMLDRCGVPYRSVDLDSVAYQKGDRGGKIRAVLKNKTAWTTIPQIFVGSEFVGGCTDMLELSKKGELVNRLQTLGIAHNDLIYEDPYSYLPVWLHPR